MSSPYSDSNPLKEGYNVFISFRGEDVRGNFKRHLQKALEDTKKFSIFDDKGLKRGKDISGELRKAIEDSYCSIIICSENYASSSWCLDELVLVVEKHNLSEQYVLLPIFYHVDPSQVRKQTGSYGEALQQHQHNFPSYKVSQWKEALRTIGNLTGWSLEKR